MVDFGDLGSGPYKRLVIRNTMIIPGHGGPATGPYDILVTGNVIAWSSAGVRGFKGSRKSTPFAAQMACEDAVQKARIHGLKSVKVLVDGPGAGREAALRALSHTGLRVSMIKDITPVAHNGCRPPKRRRV